MEKGITISSSGTSGDPKLFYQSPAKLSAANQVARTAQKISADSKIYTCCKITHAGGLLAQTLPALAIGVKVDIVPFTAYDFVRDIHYYTHSHITPLHAKAIMLTKGFRSLDLSGVWITCGADPVSWDIIEAFVDRGAILMTNWGMSEVGPVAINTVFDSMAKVKEYRAICPSDASILGDVSYCDYKVENNELHVAGDICIYDGWYATKDRVTVRDGILFYQGRTNKETDLWTPKKG